MFQRLLVYASVRGQDSTGAASVKRHENKGRPVCKVAKELGNPYELLNISRKFPEEDFGDVLSSSSRALLGHCRSSTVGESTRRNAHPYLFEHIIGTHNGTFSLDTRKDFKDYAHFDTDSQCFFSELNDSGLEAVMQKIGKNDAYALIWYDFRDNTVNFLRNSKRPLFYCFNKDRDQLFWASEAGHLFAALNCEGSDAVPHLEGPPEKWIYELPIDTHMSWKIPEYQKTFEKAHAVKREGKKPDPFQNYRQNWKDGQNGSRMYDTGYGYYENQDLWNEYSDDSKDIVYWDESNHYYKKFSGETQMFSYSKNGPWYTTPQFLWDSLSEAAKINHYFYDQYPAGVVISKEIQDKVKERLAKANMTPEEHAKALQEEQKGKVIAGPGNIDQTRRNSLLRKMIESRWNRLDQIRGPEAKGLAVFRDKDKAAYYHEDKKIWETWSYPAGVGNQQVWIRSDWKNCPDWVPFTKHDIQARHFWRTVGKKKNKVRAYIGFKGNLLVRPTFEKLMSDGCLNCQRVPEWGNEVTFVSPMHWFCEHCSRDKERIEAYLKMS